MCCDMTLWNVNVRKSLYTIQSLMVSVGMSKWGCTHLIFVDSGVKVNGCYYRELLLSQQLLPAIWQVSGDFFVGNKTVHRRTGHARQSSCCNGRRPLWSHLICGLWIAQISTPQITIFGEWCKIGSTKKSEGRERVERAIGWGRSRTATERDWRCHRPCSGADACVPAFGLEEDILSLCCDCISYLGYGSWSSLKIYR